MHGNNDGTFSTFGSGKDAHVLLGQILKGMKLITESQIQEALAIQRTRGGGLFGEILAELNYVSIQEVRTALGVQVGMNVIDLDNRSIPAEVVERVSPAIARKYEIMPLSFRNGALTVALADPSNYKTIDDLQFALGLDIRGAVSTPPAVARAQKRYYDDKE